MSPERSEGVGCTSWGTCSQHSSSFGQEMVRNQGSDGSHWAGCNLRLHFQRRGHEGKCVAMVPDPKKAWGGRGDLQSARLGSSVAMKAGEQQDGEHWPGPLLSSSTEEHPQSVTTGSPETCVCPLGEQRRGRVFPSRPLLPWGSAGT